MLSLAWIAIPLFTVPIWLERQIHATSAQLLLDQMSSLKLFAQTGFKPQ
jgi:hypothetical protein